MTDENPVVAAIDSARPAGLGHDDEIPQPLDHENFAPPPRDVQADERDDVEIGDAPSGAVPDDAETQAKIAECAALDASDTDNGRRLIVHRGADLAVLQETGGKRGEHTWLAWSGKFWDVRDGGNRATIKAQEIGPLIAAEAEFLPLPATERAFLIYDLPHLVEDAENVAILIREMEREDPPTGEGAAAKKRETALELRDLKAELKRLAKQIGGGHEMLAAHEHRKARRRAFGVTSKNSGRINSMLAMAGPHLVTPSDAWDADQRLVYVANGALRFIREPDLESPDDTPGAALRMTGRVEFEEDGFRREDRVTRMCDVAYRRNAPATRWLAMLERFLPDARVRDAVQVFCGLGLTGVPIQMLLFHFGSGANGKSVFLEVLTRVLGALAEGLPPSSITGSSERGQGQASPDLAKLEGARFVRISELPEGEPLREELIKALTGGEKMESRALFKGYHSFQPQFKAHMSGNGYPYVAGSNEGIWRRLIVVPWTVTIPVEERRDFETVVAELMEEAEGVLAWLAEGMRRFDAHGLVIPQPMREASAAMRDEMDPINKFFAECVTPDANAPDLPARDFYAAYVRWSEEIPRKPKSQARFGAVASQRFERLRVGSGVVYRGLAMHDVPVARTDRPPPHDRNPRDE